MDSKYASDKKMKPWIAILFGLIFTVSGIVTLYITVPDIVTYKRKDATFTKITSKVVDYNYDENSMAAVIVEYEVNGQKYRKQSNQYAMMPKEIGTEIFVKYNPSDPKDSIWVNEKTSLVFPIFGSFFAIGGFSVLISGVIACIVIKKNPPTEKKEDTIRVMYQ